MPVEDENRNLDSTEADMSRNHPRLILFQIREFGSECAKLYAWTPLPAVKSNICLSQTFLLRSLTWELLDVSHEMTLLILR